MTDERLLKLRREERRLQALSVEAHYREDRAAIREIKREYQANFAKLLTLCHELGIVEKRGTTTMKCEECLYAGNEAGRQDSELWCARLGLMVDGTGCGQYRKRD